MTTFASMDKGTEQVLHSAVSSLALPSASSDGASISVAEQNAVLRDTAGGWRHGGEGGARLDAVLHFEGSAALTFSAAVGLYGFRSDTSKWYLVGQLNSGTAPPVLASTAGWATIVESVGIYERLAVGPLTTSAVTITGGTLTVRAAQIRVHADTRAWQ